MNKPWHDVSYGDRSPEFVNGIIEIPKQTRAKYELDKSTGMLKLDRVLYASTYYPANYGFIPRTYCDDGDPLDVLVLCQEPITPLCLVECLPIGVITMTDEKGQDDKIIAVHAFDPAYNNYHDISALPPHVIKELKRFFQDYKILENKDVIVDALRGRLDAINTIKDAIKLYNSEFKK